MSKQLLHLILLFLVCGALLFMAATLPQQVQEPDVCDETNARESEAAGTQLLWESLSRQFVSSVQY